MKINGSPAYTKAVKIVVDRQNKVKEMLSSKPRVTQEESPELRQMRELMRQNKRNMENSEDEKIAKKIARGEAITEAEREKLRTRNPEKLRKAEEANTQRASISKKLERAKTKAEAASIIAEAKSLGVAIFEKGDPELGELFIEAAFKAESDYYAKKKAKDAHPAEPVFSSQKPTIDIRL